MEPAFILTGALVVVGTILWLLDCRGRARDEEGNLVPTEVIEPQPTCDDDCCGTHEVCPSEQLLRHQMCEVVYYDDQELDAYAGRGTDDYADEEVEQFRDVLYTLLPSDRLGWERSLKRRGIALPAALRDELLMLLNETDVNHNN